MNALGVFTYPVEGWRDLAVGFEIDGIDIRRLLRTIELPFAEAEGHKSIAGQYGGLAAEDALPPSSHLLGEPTLLGMGPGTAVLGCECGEWGCWPLMADVRVEESTVTWTGFYQPHRRSAYGTAVAWKYDGFGPFVFDRTQYEEALASPRRLSNDPLD